jgi:hypothetical protein
MQTHQPTKLGRQRNHHVEVGNRQEQVTLVSEPSGRSIATTLRTRAMTAGVEEQMLAMAILALGNMAAERTRAAPGNRLNGTDVTGQYGIAVTLQVVSAVPTQNIGNPEHDRAGD